MILIAAHPTGLHVIDDRGAIKLPTALRRLCGLECGVPVVLAAVVPEQVMVVHPCATVAQLLADHYTDLLHTEEEDARRCRGGHDSGESTTDQGARS